MVPAAFLVSDWLVGQVIDGQSVAEHWSLSACRVSADTGGVNRKWQGGRELMVKPEHSMLT